MRDTAPHNAIKQKVINSALYTKSRDLSDLTDGKQEKRR